MDQYYSLCSLGIAKWQQSPRSWHFLPEFLQPGPVWWAGGSVFLSSLLTTFWKVIPSQIIWKSRAELWPKTHSLIQPASGDALRMKNVTVSHWEKIMDFRTSEDLVTQHWIPPRYQPTRAAAPTDPPLHPSRWANTFWVTPGPSWLLHFLAMFHNWNSHISVKLWSCHWNLIVRLAGRP